MRAGRRTVVLRVMAVVATAGLAAAAVATYAAVRDVTDPHCERGFEPADWRTHNRSDRKGIAKKIDQCGYIDGRTRQEVKELLGAATLKIDRLHWSYTLGSSGFLLPKNENLIVTFNDDGRVAGTGIRKEDD